MTTAPHAVAPAPVPAVEAVLGVRRFTWALVGAGALAWCIRVALVLAVRDRHEYGFDATWYHAVANRLADGGGFAIGAIDFAGGFVAPFGEVRPTALFPPLHPFLLAAASVAGLDTPVHHQLVTVTVGSATAVLVGLLGAAVSGDRRVGLVAALLAAGHPLLVGADVAMMSEPLWGLLVTATLLLLVGGSGGLSAPRGVALGALLGAACLTRSEGPLFAAGALAVAVLGARPGARGRAWRGGAVALVVAAAVVAPWLVRNAVRVDAGPVLATNTGATIAGANCDLTYGDVSLGSWDIRCIDFDEWRRTQASEADFFADLRSDGLRYARDHTDRWPAVVAARLGRVSGLYRPVSQLDVAATEGRHRPVELAGVAAGYALAATAIAGLALLHHRGRPVLPLLLPVAVVVVAAAAVYGNPRFRHAAEPSLAVGAAVALVALWDRHARARR